jgi:hypothetical protein
MTTTRAVRAAPVHRDTGHIERYAVFAFGVIFLIAILVLVIWIPRPTIAQFFAFRLTLALAASGVGALMPGFISLEQPLPHKGLLRAGGALALFVLVWSTNPAKLAIEEIAPPPIADARKVIEEAIRLVDEHDYARVYAMYSTGQRNSISEKTFAEMFGNARDPLGARTKGPQLYNGSAMPQFMGVKGPFVTHVYVSRFAGSPQVWAEATAVIAEDGQWKMNSHVIGPCEPPSCVVPANF